MPNPIRSCVVISEPVQLTTPWPLVLLVMRRCRYPLASTKILFGSAGMFHAIPPFVIFQACPDQLITPAGFAFTVSEPVAECVNEPLTPVTVKLYVPAASALAVVITSVEVPEVLTELGVNVPLLAAGRPEMLRLTVPVNPPVGVIVAV